MTHKIDEFTGYILIIIITNDGLHGIYRGKTQQNIGFINRKLDYPSVADYRLPRAHTLGNVSL